MAAKWRNLGAVESGGLATSYTDQDGAYMDYDSAGGYVQFGAKKTAAGSLGLKLRTILAGVATTVLTFTSAGNAGFGVTPATWNAAYQGRVIQFGSGGTVFASDVTSAFLGANYYIPAAGGDKFLGTGRAANVFLTDGTITLRVSSAAGVLDGAITWVNALSLAQTTGAAVFAAGIAGGGAGVSYGLGVTIPTGSGNHGYGFYSSGARGSMRMSSSFEFVWDSNSHADAMILTSGGQLILNQMANDGEILSFRSSDVAHGMTNVTSTETYAFCQKASATEGGLNLRGLTEGNISFDFTGIVTTEDATRSTGAVGSFIFQGQLKAGTSTGSMSADRNIAVFRNGAFARHILDTDGDSHQDVGTAWTNFDAHDDVALLNLMAAHVTRRSDPLRRNFGQWLGKNRADLEMLKLVTFNDDGHHFVNMSRLTMLHTGAIRQIGSRQQQLEAALRKVIDVNPQLVGRDDVLALLDHSTN